MDHQDVKQAASKAAEEATRRGPNNWTAWLPLGDIDQTPPELNSRSTYDESTLNELAQSVKELGVLQPICVRPSGF